MKIAELLASGASREDISKRVDLGYDGVCKRLRREDVKEYLEKLQMELISDTLSTAKNNISSLVNGYRDAPEKTMEKEHGYRASIKVMEAAGLLPSTNSSIYIQQIYNDNRVEIPQEVKNILDAVVTRDLSVKSLLEEDDNI